MSLKYHNFDNIKNTPLVLRNVTNHYKLIVNSPPDYLV
jgi:hypothetical protein